VFPLSRVASSSVAGAAACTTASADPVTSGSTDCPKRKGASPRLARRSRYLEIICFCIMVRNVCLNQQTNNKRENKEMIKYNFKNEYDS
jgi:hypothetical protein